MNKIDKKPKFFPKSSNTSKFEPQSLFRKNFLFFATISVSVLVGTSSTLQAAPTLPPAFSTPLRGVNGGPYLLEQDFADLAKLKVNVVRLSFPNFPLMSKTPPYSFNQQAFEKLDQLLDWCEKYGIYAVIDPHTYPGTEKPYSTRPTDPIWSDYYWHSLLIQLWEKIAERYKNRGNVIAGYDIFNEPTVPQGPPNSGPANWDELSKKIIAAIRKHDNKHTIILEPIMGKTTYGKSISHPGGMQYMSPPPDQNIVYSPHMYEPGSFTHQRVIPKLQNKVSYPGITQLQYWNKETLRQVLSPVIDFQKKYGVKIFMGEFGAARWTGEDGNKYLKDVMDLFEENGWSWAYHSFRERNAWDPELSNTDQNDTQVMKSTPRLELLKSYFQLNQNKN